MKYLFLDIDGTLYSSKTFSVPKSASDAIKEARRNGHKVFLCTGRSRSETGAFLNYPVDGFVFASGAHCIAEGTTVFDHPIPTETVHEIEHLIHSLGYGLLVGCRDTAYTDARSFAMLGEYNGGPGASTEERKEAALKQGFIEGTWNEADPAYKLGALTDHNGSFESLIQALPVPYQLIITIPFSGGDFAEITDSTITKTCGIKKILESYGADLKDAIAIGDSGNDVDMIRSAGLGIAMGNGFAEAKQAADWVTGDIDEDGIRNAFIYAGVIRGEQS